LVRSFRHADDLVIDQLLQPSRLVSLKSSQICAALDVQTDERMRTEADLNRITSEIIGGAIAVHTRVGPGCFESAYIPCLAYELQQRGLSFQTKVAVDIQYATITVRRAYEVDFLVEGNVVVELKATSTNTPVDARQLLTYLRFTGCPLGLLVNFGALKLTDGIKRVVNNFPNGTPPGCVLTTQSQTPETPTA
jgi:GxxExxY protein